MASKATESVENSRCKYCSAELTDASKVIPECGSTICSGCYYDIAEEADDSRLYNCQACNLVHTLPLQDLPNRKPLEKPLSSHAKALRSVLREIEARMEKLRSFDNQEYVHAHCDQLELEVHKAVDRIIESLESFEKASLEQISRYREQSLHSASPTMWNKILTDSHMIDKFSWPWNKYFSRADAKASERDIRNALYEANEFLDVTKSLEYTVKNDALDGERLEFMPNRLFFENLNKIGELICNNELSIQSSPAHTLVGHSEHIRQVLFLPDGRVVSCSADTTIKIWKAGEKKQFDELVGHTDEVCSIVVLSGGLLASGSRDTTIRTWNLQLKKRIRTLNGHTCAVVSLQALKNGFMASYSLDDTIKIWNPYRDHGQGCLCFTMKRHGNSSSILPLGVLSNGNLVTCCRAEDTTSQLILKVWNLDDRRFLKMLLPSSDDEVSTLLVLSDDQIAIGSENGAITIFDPLSQIKSQRKDEAHIANVASLVQLSNGNLVSCGDDGYVGSCSPTIKVWNLLDFSLLQIIPNAHEELINSLSVSYDEKYLVSAGRDCSIKLWPMIIQSSQQT